jgi:CTP:molybdopterin cytidylyltransferase MocA
MGCPKSALPFPVSGGQITFLERALSLASHSVSSRKTRVVVSNQEILPINEILRVINPQPERGMFSSIQVGLRDLVKESHRPYWTLLHMVDHPLVTHQTVEVLFSQATSEYDVIIPTCNMRTGHPILLSPRLVQRCLDAADNVRLDALIQDHRTHTVSVNDQGIFRNINTPSLYQWFFGPLP